MSNKDSFFEAMERLKLSLTFDDVTLRTGRATARKMPHEVSIESYVTRNVPVSMPIVSAAMDTVTEYRMAIALAVGGGLGVIHRGLSPKEQAKHVARVKYYMNGLIEKPICVRATDTIREVLTMRAEKSYPFHSFPVLDCLGKLVGVVTRNDFDFSEHTALTIRQIMSSDVVQVPEGTKLDDAYRTMLAHKVKVLPVVDAEQHVTGLYIFSDLKRIKTKASPFSNIDERGQLRVAAAIGTGEEDCERLELLQAENVDVIVIDTAHGDSQPVYQMIQHIRSMTKKFDVLVGNISEPESAKRLADVGIDGIKIGQGPGSICTTRKIAGIGQPQVTAVYNCAKAIEGSGIPICADGGIRYTGDIAIAIATGAHTVMLGSMLAGTTEAPGDIVFYQGRQWKRFRGMGSIEAMSTMSSARARYSEISSERSQIVPEGVSGLTPFKGPVEQVLHYCVGGLRKAMGYVGAENVRQLHEIAEFTRTTAKGEEESHPHNVLITEEAPNYQKPGGDL